MAASTWRTGLRRLARLCGLDGPPRRGRARRSGRHGAPPRRQPARSAPPRRADKRRRMGARPRTCVGASYGVGRGRSACRNAPRCGRGGAAQRHRRSLLSDCLPHQGKHHCLHHGGRRSYGARGPRARYRGTCFRRGVGTARAYPLVHPLSGGIRGKHRPRRAILVLCPAQSPARGRTAASHLVS